MLASNLLVVCLSFGQLLGSKVFSDTFSTTAIAVYNEFKSAEALVHMDLQELTDFIMEKGKNRFPNPNSVANAIQ